MKNIDPVLADQRHDVGDRSQGDQVEPLPEIGHRDTGKSTRIPQGRPQSDQQVESHADTGQRREGVSATGLQGIQYGTGIRQDLSGRMMVDYDQVGTEASAEVRLIHSGDTAVDRNDQLRTLCDDGLDGGMR